MYVCIFTFGGGVSACASENLLRKHITSVQPFLILCPYLTLVINFMGLEIQLEKTNA